MRSSYDEERGPRDWAWAVDAPDVLFTAGFAPEDAGRLAELLTTAELPGFVRDPRAADGMTWHDEHAFAQLEQHRARGERKNIYRCHELTLRGSGLHVFRGYDGTSERCRRTETELLARLARTPGLTWQGWSVRDVDYGGRGAEGQTGAQLQAYLGGYLPPRQEGEW